MHSPFPLGQRKKTGEGGKRIMAPVPAWTKDWRPLAKELCARVCDSGPAPHRAVLSPEMEDAEHSSRQETLLLRADRVVGQLYAHRFMECMPQDVQHELDGMAAKFRVHSLEERAQKLQMLAASCDFQVLKLLLELAERPTAAADEDVAVGPDTTTGWMRVWQEEQTKQMQEKQLENQLVEELFQISTNDEWYQAWEESDAEESDWEMSESEDAVESDGSVGGRRRSAKRSNAALDGADDRWATGTKASLDSRVSSVFATRQQVLDLEGESPQPLVKRQEFSEEILLRDELLKRYYPEVSLQKANSMDSEDEVMEDSSDENASCLLANEKLVPFTMERPWLLCSTIVHTASTARRDPPLPLKLIHEQTVVNMVFQALDGVESLLFELQPVRPTPALLSVDFRTSSIQLSRRARTMAIGHLSPLALYHFLEEFAIAASELQLLRDLLGFITQTREELECQRCVTLEGLANALSEILRCLSEEICDAEQQINTPMAFEDDDAPWAGSTARPPTLLGIYGALKENFQTISWLKQVLENCFQILSTRDWHEIKRAEQAKDVLDALYRMMEVEFVEGSQENEAMRSSGSWSRYDMLLHLFIGSLSPYLDLLNQMLFENGHFETIPLNGELFFTSPASLSIATTSPTRTERAQSFHEGLLTLAPFEVKRALVPAFLESVIGLMNEALASRQMKNRFLQHRQRTTDDYLKPRELQSPSLRELFLSEIGEMGWSHTGRIASLSVFVDRVEATTISSGPRMIDCMPFNRIVERCLTGHADRKCRELNGSITEIFRDQMRFLEHVDALRMFVLMEQQDVFGIFSAKLVAQMQVNPLKWADSERINALYQSAIQEMLEDNMLSTSLRQLGGQICICIDPKHLDSSNISRKVDVATMKCLHFAFSIQQPLRVLFSAAIMQKYSRVGIFLVQVKAVESVIVKFKYSLRHRRCYSYIERDVRGLVMQVTDMLHYTKSLLTYLTSQISSEGWSKFRRVLESSRSLAEMDEAHEKYLDLLLNRFFLLDKHATVIQYILTTFNHILHFVSQVDELVKAVERNVLAYFPQNSSGDDEQTADSGSNSSMLQHPDFRLQHTEMTKSAKEFKRQSHFLVVMLTAMQKHGASPHVNEILTQLNYNYYYHRQEQPSRPRSQQQGSTEISVLPLAPAPKRPLARSRSAYLP